MNPLKVGGDVRITKAELGMLLPDTKITFEKGESSGVNLTGKSKGKITRQSIINPTWDFQKMGIGGLDKEFNAIFRRAFASRVFPPELVDQLGEESWFFTNLFCFLLRGGSGRVELSLITSIPHFLHVFL
jgi:vesicle-fusing ATPase